MDLHSLRHTPENQKPITIIIPSSTLEKLVDRGLMVMAVLVAVVIYMAKH